MSILSIQFYFKNSSPKAALDSAILHCNEVLLKDFGPNHELSKEDPPDLIATATNTDAVVVGLLTLHYTEAARVWELGTMSAAERATHNSIFKQIMGLVPAVLINNTEDRSLPLWVVKRVKQNNRHHIRALRKAGFEEPAHFMIGVLSNEGYIPFDPFDEVLMKMRLCPIV
jgi:hypothetical protein